ncbi:MAG: ABC transporter substrate-binding protein [Clostridium sp.]|uniref:ABC transporter substrate-binding protein n=1 Tax=Clostridium sp. TaxID=1506 RepID=UPI002A91746C|nr:ABC transporter substrate-binding protein [Clostridium sp.]MDY6228853.1 ABC transporter substrate-binding protein [Clostridium sp.]
MSYLGKHSSISEDVVILIDEYCEIKDPIYANDFNQVMIYQSLFETLVVLSLDGNTVKVGAADKYKYDYKKKKLYFYFYGKSRWSNGKNVTAFDFERTFKKAIIPNNSCQCAEILYPIKNAFEIHTNKNKDINSLGVKALNENTLEIELEENISTFLISLTNPCFSPTYEDDNKLLSNGPFYIDEVCEGKFIKVTKNPFYYNSEKKNINSIKFEVEKNFLNQIDKYNESKAHITSNTLFKYDYLEWARQFKDFKEDILSIGYYIFINYEKCPELKKDYVRLAIYNQIDKRSINDSLNNGLVYMDGFIPGILDSFQNKAKSKDSKNNRSLFLKNINLSNLNIKYTDYYPNKTIVETIAKQLKDNLKLRITLQKESFNNFKEDISNNNYELALVLITANYNSPLCIYDNFIDHEVFNNRKSLSNDFENRIYELLTNINLDYKEKIELYEDINDILMNILPVIPLFHLKSYYFQKPWINNFIIYPSGQFSFENFDITNM